MSTKDKRTKGLLALMPRFRQDHTKDGASKDKAHRDSKTAEKSKLDRHVDSQRVRKDDADGRSAPSGRKDDHPSCDFSDDDEIESLHESWDAVSDDERKRSGEAERRRRNKRLGKTQTTIESIVESVRKGQDVDMDEAVNEIASIMAAYIEDTGDEVHDTVQTTGHLLSACIEVARNPDVRGKQADLLSERPVKLDTSNWSVQPGDLDTLAKRAISTDRDLTRVRTRRIIVLTQMARYPMRIHQTRAPKECQCALTGARIEKGQSMEFAAIDTNDSSESAHTPETRRKRMYFVPLSIKSSAKRLVE